MDTDGLLQSVQAQINANNAWSAEQAQKQMEFQERMSNTAHQREMADLQASGLNPILSAKLGGASTPSGASASADPNATSALVSMIGKILDIESDNAKANLARASSGSGYSGTGIQANTPQAITSQDVNGLLSLVGEGLPNSAIKVADKMYKIGDEIADRAGLDNDSSVRKYLNGTTLAENVENAKNFVANTVNQIVKAQELPDSEKSLLQKAVSSVNNAFNTVSNAVSTTAGYIAQGIKQTVNNPVQAVKDFGSSIGQLGSAVKNAVSNLFKPKTKVIKKGSTR